MADKPKKPMSSGDAWAAATEACFVERDKRREFAQTPLGQVLAKLPKIDLNPWPEGEPNDSQTSNCITSKARKFERDGRS